MSFLISLLSFLSAITVLVFIHEYGHFKVARMCGVKVKRFSIGFGKPFYTKVDRYGTEWSIAPIPMGGYVSMVDSQRAPLEKGEEGSAFDEKNLWQRSAIVVAGPLANLIFAWVAWSVMLSGASFELKAYLGNVIEGSLADKAGFQASDKILAIDNVEVKTLSDVHLAIVADGLNEKDAKVVVDRSGKKLDLTLPLSQLSAASLSNGDILQAAGFASPSGAKLPARVKTIVPQSPADIGGLHQGDRVVSIEGRPIKTWSDMGVIVNVSAEKPLKFMIERLGQPVELTITPKIPEKATLPLAKIGATVEDEKLTAQQKEEAFISVDRGVGAAMVESAERCYKISALTLNSIGSMLTGKAGASGISGPVGIAQQAGDAADSGIKSFMNFLAFLSMSLFLMNLLPLPSLDGGHLALFAVEGVLGRPLSEKAQARMNRLGISFLAALMILALVNDLSKLLS